MQASPCARGLPLQATAFQRLCSSRVPALWLSCCQETRTVPLSLRGFARAILRHRRCARTTSTSTRPTCGGCRGMTRARRHRAQRKEGGSECTSRPCFLWHGHMEHNEQSSIVLHSRVCIGDVLARCQYTTHSPTHPPTHSNTLLPPPSRLLSWAPTGTDDPSGSPLA
jgi:hypothetical protein